MQAYTRIGLGLVNRQSMSALGLGFLAWLLAMPVLAAAPGGEAIDWLRLGMGLFGGLALFLFGMEQMSHGLKAAAGESLKNLLAKLTRNRFLGALTGAFVTAVLNSSSVTTVLVVGFITAGIMNLSQSIGVIMGANIGSTFTAQIIAFNVTQYALLMVVVGFLMLYTGKRDKTRQYGEMIMGLGLVFYGMGVMSEAMTPMRTYQPFLDLMVRMENPLLGILVGAVFTGLVQSSAATTGIAIVMATEGLISLPAGIALAFGANVGTCATALLAAIGKPPEAVRAAVAHIVFNVTGVLLWVAFIPQLAGFVEWISPAYPHLEGKARAAAEVPRQIANAHTVFNVANTLIFIWFTTYLARLVERLVPERPEEEKIIIRPKYLDEELIGVPALALERVRFELGRMGEITQEMLGKIPDAFLARDREAFDAIARMDDKVDILQASILGYLGKIRKQALTDAESQELFALMTASDNLESIGDIVETDLVDIGHSWIENDFKASETMKELATELEDSVARGLHAAVQAVRDDDQRAAQDVLTLKDEVHERVDSALQHQAGRLGAGDERHLEVLRLEMEFVDKLKRIYALSKRMAKAILPEAVAKAG